MNRKKVILIISIFTLISLAGCSFINNKSTTSQVKINGNAEAPDKAFFIGKRSLNSKDSNQWEEQVGKQQGVFTKDFGDYIGYLIGFGKKPTGGYSVDIQTNIKGDKLSILFQEKLPPKGNFNTQVITYNYNVIYIKKENYRVEINKIHDDGKSSIISNIIKTK